ncbi:hypothetical protein B0H21DRAFT_166641 [Amylocystis lapponica]|nr:hypothetical protein B0H21DRAFT_166641 [Amylocystis lapponica]
MDLHLLPLSATDVESDSDYLATPVDTPYPSAPYPHILQANQHPFSSPGAYRSPPPPSSATCDAPATRGAPHLDFGREVFDPATFGQNQPYVLDRYSSSDLAQHPPSDWIDHGVSDFPKVEITPWITRPKFQPADLPLQHAHEYTPDSCFEAEATYDDAREVAAAAGRMSYDLEHRVSDLPPSQHLHEYGFRQCDGHVSSSSPPVFSPLADYAADDLPHERIHQPSAYFDTASVLHLSCLQRH